MDNKRKAAFTRKLRFVDDPIHHDLIPEDCRDDFGVDARLLVSRLALGMLLAGARQAEAQKEAAALEQQVEWLARELEKISYSLTAEGWMERARKESFDA